MDWERFLELVEQMRAADKRYYRERSKPNLLEAKKLEKQVDEMIAIYRKTVSAAGAVQLSLIEKKMAITYLTHKRSVQ